MINLIKLANDFKSQLDRLDTDPDNLSWTDVDPEFYESEAQSDELHPFEEPLNSKKFPYSDNGASLLWGQFMNLSKQEQDDFISKIWKLRRKAK